MDNSQLNWYAAKVFYNKVFLLEERFAAAGYASYIAVAKVLLKGEGRSRAIRALARSVSTFTGRYFQEGGEFYERKPLVSSLFFFQVAADDLPKAVKLLSGVGFIYKDAEGKDFAAIPEKQMASFRLVTSSGETGLTFFADDDFTRYRRGNRVRVLQGPLKGAEGYIRRIKKDRRLLVSIEGVVAVATTYIPPEMLEIVPENA